MAPDAPHHVTQQVNRRGDVFFTEADREVYLRYLAEYDQKHALDILTYCLMSNHVVTVTFRMQHVCRDHERGDCYSVQFAPDVAEGEKPSAATEALMRQLLELTGRPLFCGNPERPEEPMTVAEETERRRQVPDRRPGTCRKFRFTHDALVVLPPHPREHRAGQGGRPPRSGPRPFLTACMPRGSLLPRGSFGTNAGYRIGV